MIKIKNKLGKTRIYHKKYRINFYKGEKFKSKKINIKDDKPTHCGGLRFKGLFKKNIKDKPLISIVMPNFRCPDIKKAIKSVLKQNYENLELIIIDGNSGKKTVKILKFYEKDIDIWISENDNGMWDAWNKGFQLANGDYVGIVDSSNILFPGAIKNLIKYIKKYPQLDFICGAVKKDNRLYAGIRVKDIKRQFNIIPSSVVSFFIKLKSLKKVGLLNTRYKIQADYDLLYRIIVKNKMKGINTKSTEVFGDLGDSGFSHEKSFIFKLVNELRIRFDNNQNIFELIYIFFGRVFIKILRMIR